MATTFKTFTNNDVVTARSLLHEAIPLTGTILSGVYGEFGSERNIKNFSHGMFQSCYDYPYLSSSANHILDLTVGYHSSSGLSAANPDGRVQQDKKIAIYNQMAQLLMGHDVNGAIQKFDADGNIIAGGTKINSAFFMNFSRLLVKDEIKKGSFTLKLGVHPTATGSNADVVTIQDTGAATDYKVNSPAGEYGILKAASITDADQLSASTGTNVGLVFYQAGVAVLTSSVFSQYDGGAEGKGILKTAVDFTQFTGPGGGATLDCLLTGSSISGACDNLRHRIVDLSFNNTTELNSTIYFCRANHNDFNYTANPTYLTGSKIRVKTTTTDLPVSYITTVGLYSADNELLATAKLSEPLKKDPTNELTLRVRLDY